MASMPSSVFHDVHDEARSAMRTILDGSIAQAIGGVIAAALAILGLVGVVPATFAAVATIAVGGALLFEGGAIATRYERILAAEVASGERIEHSLGSGMAAETAGGIAGIVLGVLALLGVAPGVLVPVAVIVYGAAVLFGAGATAGVNALLLAGTDPSVRRMRIAREAGRVAAGGDILLGLGAVALGILSLLTLDMLGLALIALLVLGVATLLNGVAIGGEVVEVTRTEE